MAAGLMELNCVLCGKDLVMHAAAQFLSIPLKAPPMPRIFFTQAQNSCCHVLLVRYQFHRSGWLGYQGKEVSPPVPPMKSPPVPCQRLFQGHFRPFQSNRLSGIGWDIQQYGEFGSEWISPLIFTGFNKRATAT